MIEDQLPDTYNGPGGNGTGATATSYDPYARIRQIYSDITGGKYTPTNADLSQWGTDINSDYESKIRSAVSDWWKNYAPPTAPPPSTTTPPPTTTGGGTGGGVTQGLPNPFGSTFTPPPTVNLGGQPGIEYIPPTPQVPNAPTPNLPTFKTPDPFKAPSMADVLNEPGYQFSRDQGLGAINNSRAAQGLWGTGATGKVLEQYAGDLAATHYNDMYNRALNTYTTNVGTQNVLPYQYNYQRALDLNSPETATWNARNNMNTLGYQTQSAAGQHANDMNYLNAYNKWVEDFNQKYRTGNFLFNVNNA